MSITGKTKLCMVIGDPVVHSLSPQMHNAGYEAINISDQYVYVAVSVAIKNIADFVKGVRAMNIRGISCTLPHKIEVMPYLDEIDEIAKKIGAVNTIVNDNGILKGYNTDYLGVLLPLEQLVSLTNKTVVILGAGGAARAAAYAVTSHGARLVMYNRTFEKAQELAKEFHGEALSSEKIEEIKNADIIINATSVGLHPNEKETPLPKELITNKQIVFDAVYSPFETRLLKEAKEKCATIIHGTEMLLHQGAAQFSLYTTHDAPIESMRKALLAQIT